MLLKPTSKTLVGRQAADAPMFSIETDDCMTEYKTLKKRGVEFEGEPEVRPYGIGVMMKDPYGTKIYLNEDVPNASQAPGGRRGTSQPSVRRQRTVSKQCDRG